MDEHDDDDGDTGIDGGLAPGDPDVPTPPDPPGDWASVVHRGVWTDIERLGLWNGRDTKIKRGSSPHMSFGAVRPGSLGHDPTRPIYVVVHGWAPGYRKAVETAHRKVLWWGPNASDGTVWASDWCWSQVESTGSLFTDPVCVDSTGVLQQIYAYDSTATALAFSWIDDSATDGGIHLTEAYWSEGYTHTNGIRLANALEAAIDPGFLEGGGQLHLIGHSHGSKVCAVAAKTLQDRGAPATHLTILDAPDSRLTREGNAANLLGFHLHELDIRDPLTPGPGMYVDNYRSYFGVTYQSADPASPVHNVVTVGLRPAATYDAYSLSYVGNAHTYAAAWYGGAAAGANERNRLPVGLAWPPVPHDHTPALLQSWSGHADDQWTLALGAAPESCRFATRPLPIDPGRPTDGVDSDGQTITLRPVSGRTYTTFTGTYRADGVAQYGLAFDLMWARPSREGLVVVNVSHDVYTIDWEYTLLVLDGRSVRAGTTTTISVSCDIMHSARATLRLFYLGQGADPSDVVTISNIRAVDVT